MDLPVTTRLIEANGLIFEIDECLPANGDTRKLALCLHGFPESKFSWKHQLPLLGTLGYRAWAPNLRGYGGSSRPKSVGAYGLDHLVADVEGLIAASKAEETLLIGHDWGAIIAWHCAMRKIRTLSRLVIMNVPHPTRYIEEIAVNPAQRRKSWYVLFFQLPRIPEFVLTRNKARAISGIILKMAVDRSRFPAEVLDQYRANALIPGAMTAMLNYYRAAFRAGRKAMAPSQNRVEVPTLIIWGEEDGALEKSLVFGTERFVSDLTVRFLPGVSHWVQQEAPETVNAILRAWLTHVPSL
ncbi:alpha/beta fold hydrolase [Beijerinckia indica]|uniref:Alpha/beta hydrolase fold n=1 Tax=Beijerinckia indica subsp. indica (strain ATCC 9039 / DSM 1715 / NCIMB 8712) TaxID=395963 RepID=B2IGH0_BEII9|nr:alpha/beta hydrolase [Beijerinckia indica]ACB94352.1 alpha/beta hydrolase fold [Beijerinckia indica subsp. indica ATCC 9039]